LVRIGDAFVYRPGAGDPSLDERRALRSPAASEARTVLAPKRPMPPPAPQGEPVASPDIGEMLAIGEAAAERGDHAAAAASFRQAAYLDPDHPLAHFHLGLALEALGDDRSAQRAFRAAAAAIATDASQTTRGGLGGLGGFGSNDLAQVLRAKLGAPSR
jgi:tetratricopeptide (TPR) repeat protein